MTVLSSGARPRAINPPSRSAATPHQVDVYRTFFSKSSGLASVLLLLLSTVLFAAEAASMHGSIKDPQGAVVPNARVELLRDGRLVANATADQFGNYRFPHLAAGDYRLRATAPGFATQQTGPVSVGMGQSADITLVLNVAGVAESIVVSATGVPIPEGQVGASVTVLTAADYQHRLDILEPLQQIPGVQVVQSGPRGAATSLFIRGGNSTANKVLLDGVPLNDIGGTVNFGTLATAGIDQVEVLRGPNSVLFGPDAMAGVVNLTTRRGATPVPELSYSFDAGNFSTLHHDVSLGGTFRRLDYMGEFSRSDTDNGLPNSTFHNGTYVANLGLAINPVTDLRFTGRYTTTALGQPNTFPFFGIPDDSFEKDQDAFLSVTLQNQTTQRWHNLLRYGAARLRLQDVNPSPTGIPDGSGNFVGLPVTIRGANGTSVTGQAILDFAGDYPALTSSSTQRDSVYFQSDYGFNPHLTGLVAFRFEKERGFTLAFGTSSPADRNNYSYIAEIHGSVGSRAYATVGGSIEKNPVFGTTALPRLSLAYYLVRPNSGPILNGTKLRVNYGQGIREPKIFEAGSSLFGLLSGPGGAPDLIAQFQISPIAAERSRSYDAGLEQYAANGKLKLSSTFFYNQFTNQIEFVPASALPALGVPDSVVSIAGFGATINSGDVLARGLENEIEAGLGQGFSARATYTYLDEVVQRSFTSDAFFCSPPNPQPFCGNPAFPGVTIGAFAPLIGGRPFRRARHSGSFTISYSHSRLSGALSGYFASRRDDSTFLTDASFGPSLLLPNQNLAAGFQKLDFTAGYRFGPHLAAYSVIENLLSQHYEPVFGFPAAPLTFRTGVKLTVGGDSRGLP